MALNLNIPKIEQAISDGWLSKRKHPEADLYILNYTSAAQIEFHWDKETTMICRGLIVDGNWNIIARPFEKFFTIDQLTTLRNSVHHLYGMKFKNMFDGPFRAFDKADGSLGILYPIGDKMAIASRGAFESEMAIKATKMLADMGLDSRDMWKQYMNGGWSCLTRDFTFMFEIIYPENRIVVDYGNQEKLVLLDVINKENGYRSDGMFRMASTKFEAVKEYTHIKTIEDLEEDAYDGREGYVLVFDSGLRVKWKYDEYKKLHRIVTGLNENVIWDWCLEGKNLEVALDKVPDEFYNWAKKIWDELHARFDAIHTEVGMEYKRLNKELSRKDIALLIKDYKYKGLIFAILDGKEYKETIWRIVKEDYKNEKQVSEVGVCN